MRMLSIVLGLFIGFSSVVQTMQASANEDEQAQAAELATKVQNPIANLVSVPFQYNYNYKVGPYERNATNLNIQPVIPFPGEEWNVISRTIIPLNSVPIGQAGSSFGIGDVSLSLFWSPAKAGPLTWGVGPSENLPVPRTSGLEARGK